MSKKPKFIVVFILWAVFGFFPGLAFAELNGGSIYLNPSKVDIKSHPGQNMLGRVRIVNNSENRAVMAVSTKVLEQLAFGSSTRLQYAADNSLAENLVPELLRLTVPANSEKELNYILKTATGTTPGKYHYALLFSRADPKIPGPKQDIGFLISQTVSTKTNEGAPRAPIVVSGAVTNLNTSLIQTDGTMKIDMAVNSTTKEPITAAGNVVIYNWRGSRIAKLGVSPQIVKPGGNNFDWRWQNELLPGFYRMQIRLVSPDNKNIFFEHQAPFIVLPLSLIMMTGGVILLSFGIYLSFHLSRYLMSRRSQENLLKT